MKNSTLVLFAAVVTFSSLTALAFRGCASASETPPVEQSEVVSEPVQEHYGYVHQAYQTYQEALVQTIDDIKVSNEAKVFVIFTSNLEEGQTEINEWLKENNIGRSAKITQSSSGDQVTVTIFYKRITSAE